MVAFIDHTRERGRRRRGWREPRPRRAFQPRSTLAFAGRRRVYPLGRPRVSYDPFRILAPPPATADVVRAAAAASPGRRLFMLLAPKGPLSGQAIAAVPAGYRRVASRTFAGLNRIEVLVFAP